jgi:crotonobetainyl-CoA:carnitine CoA-transferase CaiB-like acyl-CoA transferase
MLVVQLGSSYACAQTALLLQRFGARVFELSAVEKEADQGGSAQLLRECLAFGNHPVVATADTLSAEDVSLILSRADVVIDDHSLAFWIDKGLDLPQLYAERTPSAHWCGITPYGLVGAGDHWQGTEITEQASGPLMIRLGRPDRHPVPLKGPQAQFAAAWHAALLVASMEWQRGQGTAGGSLLDVSIQECQYMQAELGVSNWHFNGVDLGRWRLFQGTNPYIFPTLDGDLHMLFHDREWPRVARMIGREDLAHDRRFMARYERSKHLEEVDALLTPWFMQRTRMEAVEIGQNVGMPIATEQAPVEALADPQLAFRGAFETLPCGGGDAEIRFPVGVAKFSNSDFSPTRQAQDRRAPITLDAFLHDLERDAPPAPQPLSSVNRHDSDLNSRRPLAGVRIIDLTNTWAGPRGATLLADLGAEVIKVEGVEWMDMLRGFTEPPATDPSYPRRTPGDRPWDRYIMWLGLARNKLSCAVELTKPDGLQIFRELVAVADVVLTNMSSSTRAKYGLDIDTLARINPQIILATLSGYGDTGPRAHWRLFGDGQASMAGLFHGSGYEGDRSISFGAYGDPVNGTSFAFHVAEALLLRGRTGRGMHVDLSAVETCLSYNARSFVEAQLGMDAAAPVGVDPQGRWPHGIFQCLGRDAWVVISCGSQQQRSGLIDGLRGLGVDCDTPIAAAIAGETVPPEGWEAFLSEVCATNESATLQHALQSHGAPCQRVIRGRDIDGDVVLNSRRFITWLWREDLGSYPVHGPFWLINGERPALSHAPARYGEENEYVLSGILHKSEAEIESLRRKGVISNQPLAGAELGVRPGA